MKRLKMLDWLRKLIFKKYFRLHNHRIYLGESNESESWLQYASVAFDCDPDQLRKDVMTKS